MKTRKLPSAITITIAQYYFNREKQYKANRHHVSGQPTQYTTIHTNYKWDKEADIDKIGEACGKYGFSIQCCAGTFWLFGKSKNLVYIVNEDSWPLAKIEKRAK